MTMFYVILFFVIVQRLIELVIASYNERWMKERGGIEVGRNHYKWFVILHTTFFMALFVEHQYKLTGNQEQTSFYTLFFIIFLVAQSGRIWCIFSLGKFWNTKIIVLPKVSMIKKGPYKYMKHPNYVIVFMELVCIPLTFGLYITAIIFPFLHLLLLTIRLPIEEEALHEYSSID